MKEFEIKVWEKVSLWRRLTVRVQAENEEEIRRAIENNSLDEIVRNWVDAEDNLDTLEHISYDPVIDLEVKEILS